MHHNANPLYLEIGAHISQLRRKRNLTQAELSEQLNISIKHLSEVERGLVGLSLEKLVRLCDILDTDMEFITRGNDMTMHSVELPDYIMDILKSNDVKQKQLLHDYLEMFMRIQSK